jgi:hypothetical protein
MSELKDRVNAFEMMNAKDKENFKKEIEDFFVKLTNSRQLVNHVATKDKNGNSVDELKDVYEFSNPGFQKVFREMILSLSKGMQMQMMGTGVIDARRNLQKMMENVEADPSKYNYATLFNGLGFDEHIKRDKDNKNNYTVKKGFGTNATDKYDLSSLDYLRDIKKILLEGIIVYPNGSTSQGNGLILPDGSSSSKNDMPDFKSKLAKMKSQEDLYKKNNFKYNNAIRNYSDAQKEKLRTEGKLVVESPYDLYDMSSEEIQNLMADYISNQNSESKDNQKMNGLKWVGKFLKGNTQDKYNMIAEKVNGLLQKPAELLSGVFKKIDNTMYKIIFGSDGKDDKSSFLSKTVAMMKEKFEKFGSWVKEEIFKPVKEALFGKDGIIQQFKDSQFYQTMKTNLGKAGDYLFGKASGENGKREGGLFSDTANELLDVWDGAKYYFTGKSYTNRAGVSFPDNEKSVFGHMKSMLGSFKDTMKTYLFGDKSEDADPDNKKGVLTGVLDGIHQGFINFSEAIFGPKEIGGKPNANYIAIDELKAKIKERAPKSLAYGMIGGGAGLLFGGRLGLLGSLFLPGGPIGGAVVGTTVDFYLNLISLKTGYLAKWMIMVNVLVELLVKICMISLRKTKLV